MALYHKSDIGFSGIISKLEYLSSQDNQSVYYDYFVMYLGHSTNEVLDTVFDNNYDNQGPYEVFYGSPKFTGNKDEWVSLKFWRNFPYSVKNNLVVEIKWKGCSSSALYNYVSNTNNTHTIYYYNDMNAYQATYSLNTANVIRLTIEPTNIENTSVGTLKALFK
ncbi:MAG: hypothetical protein ACUVWP_00045 [bacterium]